MRGYQAHATHTDKNTFRRSRHKEKRIPLNTDDDHKGSQKRHTLSKKTLLAIIFPSIILGILVLNEFLYFLLPQDLSEREQVEWISSWSAPLSMSLCIVIFALVYRYRQYHSQKKD